MLHSRLRHSTPGTTRIDPYRRANASSSFCVDGNKNISGSRSCNLTSALSFARELESRGVCGAVVAPAAFSHRSRSPPMPRRSRSEPAFAVSSAPPATTVRAHRTTSTTSELNSARIYISGTVTENIKVMFNTEYNAARDEERERHRRGRDVLVRRQAQHLGRPLPAAERPRQSLRPVLREPLGHVYLDGVQDGYPFETTGRDDGVMYWGQFGIAKLSFGAFDVQGLTKGDSEVLYAARAQFDFWDQGRRLLPERHVLRRQGSARARLRGPDRRQRQGLQRSTSCSRRSSATRAS